MDRIDALVAAMRDLGIPKGFAEEMAKAFAAYAQAHLPPALPQGTVSPEKPPASLELLARKLHRLSLKRADLLGELSHDPAWNMLLALIAEQGGTGRGLAISNLCDSSGVPPTTALRHIQAMVARGLIEKHPDHLDHRRVWARITQRARVEVIAILRDYSPNTPTGDTSSTPFLFLS